MNRKSRLSWISLTAFACVASACFDTFPGGLPVDSGDVESLSEMGPPPRVDGAARDVAVMPTDVEPSDGVVVADARPPIDMRPPEVDAAPPPRDMGPPPFDMAPPPVDMAPPPFDMAPPPVDMAPPPVDMGPPPDAGPPPMPEICNGIDDDLNGIVDDAPVCGRVIAQRCRVYLGWADANRGPDGPSPTWDSCPDNDTDGFGLELLACVGTRRDNRFRELAMGAFFDVNDDDTMSIAFRCDGGPEPVVAWLQRSCRVWLGQADGDAAAGRATWDAWGPCPAVDRGVDGRFNCVSSGGDGLFHPMPLIGGVDDNDAFAVAFRCTDAEDPARAAAATASAAVMLGWSRRLIDRQGDGTATWGNCPGENNAAQDDDGPVRCASSAFDGRFHRFRCDDNVDWRAAFGVSLLPHPDAPLVPADGIPAP